jgi:hypothetical protein
LRQALFCPRHFFFAVKQSYLDRTKFSQREISNKAQSKISGKDFTDVNWRLRMKVRRNGEEESSKLAVKKFCNQAAKGCWWMPWHRKAKKDV